MVIVLEVGVALTERFGNDPLAFTNPPEPPVMVNDAADEEVCPNCGIM